MSKYVWPISLLEDENVPVEKITFLDVYVRNAEEAYVELENLHNEHEILKSTSAKQERYIAELEKQLTLLQKTLDLIDKNGGAESG